MGIWLLLDSPQLRWGAFFAFLAKVSFTGGGSRLGGVRGTPSSNLIGLEVVSSTAPARGSSLLSSLLFSCSLLLFFFSLVFSVKPLLTNLS